jgi:hypothetical protein
MAAIAVVEGRIINFERYTGKNIGLPLAVAEAGTSSCMTSQCSTTLPSSL